MYIVYVLRDSQGRYYKGMTSNLKQRLRDHSRGKTKTTSKMTDLKVVYQEEAPDIATARMREKYLKSAAGRKFLKNIFDRP
jgi:putative endonuclease